MTNDRIQIENDILQMGEYTIEMKITQYFWFQARIKCHHNDTIFIFEINFSEWHNVNGKEKLLQRLTCHMHWCLIVRVKNNICDKSV